MSSSSAGIAGTIRRGVAGRVNSNKLFAFNKDLKKDALKEKGYWDDSKNSHPINRWTYRRWEKRLEDESIFRDKASKIPIDQQFKLKKAGISGYGAYIAPGIIIGYFVFSYVRYQINGTTPAEGSNIVVRRIANMSRPNE